MLTRTAQTSAAPATVAVVGRDPALASLVMGGLVAYGAEPSPTVDALPAAAAALLRGELDRLIVIGPGLPPVIGAAVARQPALAPAISLLRLPGDRLLDPPPGIDVYSWPLALGALIEGVLGSAREGHDHVYEVPGSAMAPARLLGLLATLSPDLKVLFETDLRSAALCLSNGGIRSAGLEGERLAELEGLRSDPAASLLLSLWSPPDQGDDRLALAREVGFVCEYGEIFVPCEAYRRYAVKVVSWLLSHPVRSFRFERHHPAATVLDPVEILRDALRTLSSDRLRALVGWPEGTGTTDAPATRFDTHQRLADDVLAALTAPHFEAPAGRNGRLVAEPRPRVPNRRRRSRTGLRRRVKTLTGFRRADASDISCGEPTVFFDALREARDRVTPAGHPVVLPHTRFEPVGADLGDLLLFYRIGYGRLGDTFLGLQRARDGQHAPVAVRRVPQPARSLVLRHASIVEIRELRRCGDDHLMVMEFVHGVSVAELSARLRTQGQRAAPELVRWIGAAAAGALYWAHQLTDPDGAPLGAVHRDVSSENILIGFDGAVKLVDFGLAQGPAAHDPADDQRALGLALLGLLDGVDLSGAAASGLRAVLTRAAAEAPEARFPSCGLLRDALLEGAGGDLVEALVRTVELTLGDTRRFEDEAIGRMIRCGTALFRRATVTV